MCRPQQEHGTRIEACAGHKQPVHATRKFCRVITGHASVDSVCMGQVLQLQKQTKLTCMLMIHACLMISKAAWEAAPARTQMADANMIMPAGKQQDTQAATSSADVSTAAPSHLCKQLLSLAAMTHHQLLPAQAMATQPTDPCRLQPTKAVTHRK